MGRLLGSKNKPASFGKLMRRYWIEKSQIFKDQVSFSADQFHHIFDVCRQTVGHQFEVITEDSNAFLVEVTAVEKKSASARIIETRLIQKLRRPHIHLVLSICRFPVMDSIVERAVEMGVSSIIPFYSEFSFIRKPANMPDGKLERWQKIIISACQQSGRGELMTIKNPIEWSTLINSFNPSAEKWCLFAYEGLGTLSIKDYIETKKNQTDTLPSDIWIIVGSEGGFSTTEVESMHQLGLNPVTLGSQVLRVETACLTLVSVLKYEFELLS